LAPLARAFGRAARSGTSITTTLEHAASELRQVRRWGGQARARSLGVRTAAPLGLCFMPAFIVLGVVPTVIGTFSAAVL
jgi:pilus assembly protein TadC